MISHATALDFGEDFAAGMSPEEYSEAVSSALAGLQSPKLDSMKIYFCHEWSPSDYVSRVLRFHDCIKTCLELAASKNVRELDVNLCDIECEIPCSAFQSPALTRLSLSGCSLGPPFDALELPSLQELFLDNVEISDDIFGSLLTASPNLTTIKLIHCGEHFLRTVKISSPPRLRSLTIAHSGHIVRRVDIEALTLESLHLDFYFQYIVFKDVSGLKEAHIALPYDHERDGFVCPDHEAGVHPALHWTILSAFHGVTDLTFSGPLLPLPIPRMEIRGFNKLTFMNLKSFRYQIRCWRDEFMALPNFLHFCNFPVLEQLVIEYIRKAPHHLQHEELILPTPVCPLSNLKEVIIRGFYACYDQMRLVEFLLERADSLRTLSLNVNNHMFRASELPMLQLSVEEMLRANRDAKILVQLEANP